MAVQREAEINQVIEAHIKLISTQIKAEVMHIPRQY